MSRRGPPPDISRMYSLKVDGLSHRTSLEDLESLFEKYGRVGDIYIPKDHRTRESRGFGFVRYYSKHDAEDAIDSLDGRKFDGRELSVQYARYDRPEREYHVRSRGGGGGRRRSRSRDRRSRSRDRRSRDRRSRSRDRRSRSRDRRSRSRDRRSRSRDNNKRSRSRDNKRSRSRDNKRSRSRDDDDDGRRSKSRDDKRSRSRSGSDDGGKRRRRDSGDRRSSEED
eukprot:TRINITY_DN6050_c0_g2_i1.p1 TRINITY_DN6050_c0_g2~~TRINITY_DN6050_c0_g2_i1.p1  ORF type:complete len:240 (+),score=57.94 TRINITY_DN6050_c0_g2_i1:48-722(+)